jgi:hypothetical protein
MVHFHLRDRETRYPECGVCCKYWWLPVLRLSLGKPARIKEQLEDMAVDGPIPRCAPRNRHTPGRIDVPLIDWSSAAVFSRSQRVPTDRRHETRTP